MEKGIIAELPQSETIDTDKILQQYLDGETDLVCVLGPTASGKTRYDADRKEGQKSFLLTPDKSIKI